MKVGFIGLGHMGLHMAENLVKAGHEVIAYNRTRSRAQQLLGARVAGSPAEAGAAGVVITMLADDHAVEEVVFDGVLDGLPAGGVHISMSTISVALSERLARVHRERGQQYLAAPVFGRPEAAVAAKLFIVAAGEPEVFRRCEPLFSVLGQRTFFVGVEAQRANLVKLSGNFMIAAMLESFAETMALVRKYGMEPDEFLEVITSSLFPAPIHKNYGSVIAQRKFQPAGFRLALGLKDVRLVLAAAENVKAPMPTASLLHDQFLIGMARGLGDHDWSAIAQVVAENAGLKG